MAKRRCFYSFHYEPDSWRAAMVRNIGVIEGNQPASDNGWESVKRGGDNAIKAWIDRELFGRSCTVVLVGSNTAGRKWITHEIVRSWDSRMGVVGIRIHGLRDRNQQVGAMGGNPFENVVHGPTQMKLSSIVKCYNPAGLDSRQRYDWIRNNLSAAVEEAIAIRNRNE